MNQTIDVKTASALGLILVNETALKLAKCFGVDKPLPFVIPVWVADLNCEIEPYAANLLRLRTAEGNGCPEDVSYADLADGRTTISSNLFLRGTGYHSPEVFLLRDDFGEFHHPVQRLV